MEPKNSSLEVCSAEESKPPIADSLLVVEAVKLAQTRMTVERHVGATPRPRVLKVAGSFRDEFEPLSRA